MTIQNLKIEMKELLKFIEIEDGRLVETKSSKTDTERILARTVKLMEELGELCDEVLSYNKDQRKEKLEKHNKDNLAHEFADVLITTLLLAKTMGVDIEEGLKNKIEKINKRYL